MCNFEPYILLKSVYVPVIRLVVRFTFRQAHNALFFFSIFDIIGISKNSRISVKDENFKNLSIFQSFCVRNIISKGFIWVSFHGVSKI